MFCGAFQLVGHACAWRSRARRGTRSPGFGHVRLLLARAFDTSPFVNIVRLSSIVSEMFLLLDPLSYDVDRDELFALRGA